MLAVYVRWLHIDYTDADEACRASRRPKKMSKLSLLPEESANKEEEICT